VHDNYSTCKNEVLKLINKIKNSPYILYGHEANSIYKWQFPG